MIKKNNQRSCFVRAFRVCKSITHYGQIETAAAFVELYATKFRDHRINDLIDILDQKERLLRVG